MPALDRLVTLDVPVPAPAGQANAGVTLNGTAGVIAGFHIAGTGRLPLTTGNDVIIVATDLRGGAVQVAGDIAVAGTWVTGSVLSWTDPAGNARSLRLNRPIVWAKSAAGYVTHSLRSNIPYNGAAVSNPVTVANPSVSNPAWSDMRTWVLSWAMLRSSSRPSLSNNGALNTSGVLLPAAGGEYKAWAQLLEEQYLDDPLGDGSRFRILGRSTWRLRAGGELAPFADLSYDGITWKVIGIRSVGTGRRWVEVDAQRTYEES